MVSKVEKRRYQLPSNPSHVRRQNSVNFGPLTESCILHIDSSIINLFSISAGIAGAVTRESSYCFQRVLAIAILSVCLSVRPSVCHTGGSVKNGAS